MRFAALALMAGMIFLAVAFSGFGSALIGPQDYPQAIRMTDASATGATGAAVPLPDSQSAGPQVSGSAPAMSVGHSVVSIPLVPASTPSHAPSVSPLTPSPSVTAQELPAPVFEIAPAPPDVTTSLAPATTPSPTPTPFVWPTLSPTPSPTPSPSPTGLLPRILGAH